MQFMILVHPGDIKGYEAGSMPAMELIEKMGKFNEELVNAGVMRSGEGLKPRSQGAMLHYPSTGKVEVVNHKGDAKDQIGGFWMWECKSLEDAISWAKRAPMEPGATLEIRGVFSSADFGPEVEAKENELRTRLEKQVADSQRK